MSKRSAARGRGDGIPCLNSCQDVSGNSQRFGDDQNKWFAARRSPGWWNPNPVERGALRGFVHIAFPSAWHDQADNDPSKNGDNDVCHERKWQEDAPAQIAPRGGCRKRPQALAVQECLFKDIKKFSHKGSLAKG